MNIMQKLTVGDVAAVEDLCGLSISNIGDESSPKGKMLAAMVFVIRKKQDKDFTFNDALEMQFEEVTQFLGLDEAEDDPKED